MIHSSQYSLVLAVLVLVGYDSVYFCLYSEGEDIAFLSSGLTDEGAESLDQCNVQMFETLGSKHKNPIQQMLSAVVMYYRISNITTKSLQMEFDCPKTAMIQSLKSL